MSCCFSCIRNSESPLPGSVDGADETLKSKEFDAKVTAFALAIIALTFAVVSFALYGAGAMPPTSLYGFGFLLTLGGAVFGALSTELLCGSLAMGALAAYRNHQRLTNTSI